MRLDMFTVFFAEITITAILGLLLIFAWYQNRSNHALGHWGVALLILCLSIGLLAMASMTRDTLALDVGIGLMIFAYSLIWSAARLFDGRELRPDLILVGGLGWVVVNVPQLLTSLDAKIIISCVAIAGYNFATAFEFWRGRAEPLISRWPAILLMFVKGAGFLSWIPLAVAIPLSPAGSVFSSEWFPIVIMVTLLGRIAMAFIILAMAKERLELAQKTEALTDPLTGLPNRRAFFRAATRWMRHRLRDPQPISLLMFDLDHFKKTNDWFGHAVGDRVLQVFADTVSKNLQAIDIVGRVGGEEFAVILPATGIQDAAVAAERVRFRFALAADEVDGHPIGGTVSVGVAAATDKDTDTDLHLLLARADKALYAAKKGGRNRVVMAGSISRKAAPAAEEISSQPTLSSPGLTPADPLLADVGAKV
jgi:diguanylate cyclase (GGDEF)-like protein